MAIFRKTDPGKEDMLCGIWGWTPNWLQRLKNMTIFTICFAILSIAYGMSNSYTSSMIPSLEKRFGFSSKYTGIILAMNDVAHVLAALFTAHYGGKGHRPRWISVSCFLLGLALFLHASPEIFFPQTSSATFSSNTGSTANKDLLCSEERGRLLVNSSLVNTDCEHIDNPIGPLLVLGAAHLLMGVGSTAVLILGLPFIDDNTDTKNRPIFFAISFSGRIFGPVLGYLLGAYCNSIFISWLDPGFSQTDPRWISAWYLGYLYTGMALCVFALAMGYFPASLKQHTYSSQLKPPPSSIKEQAVRSAKINTSWKEIPHNLKRLLTNGAFMFRAGAAVTDGLIIAGYMSFLPKFIGLQYQVSQSTAALAGGVPSVLAVALGVVTGGFLIRKYTPSPRHITLAITVAAIIMSAATFGVIGLGCDKATIFGFGSAEQTNMERNQLLMGNMSCPSPETCGCPDTDFQPVCNPTTGMNYYSPCHAGCRSQIIINSTIKQYRHCSCVTSAISNNISRSRGRPLENTGDSLISGLCPKACPKIYAFVGMMFVAFFLVGMPLSGSLMVLYRIVPPELKSLGTGVVVLVMSGLGLLPGPILTGSLVDSTCKLWQVKGCGERGFCLLYDTDDLRWKLHVAAGLVKFTGAIFDCLIVWKVWNFEFDQPRTLLSSPSVESSPPPSPSPLGLTPALETMSQEGIVNPTFDGFDHRRRHTISP